MRLIDAEALASDLMERWNTADEHAEKQIITVLANIVTPILVGQPTVDAVEVVRCKDCKYWAGKNGERITIPVHENCYSFTADDYCSYGERGEADDE